VDDGSWLLVAALMAPYTLLLLLLLLTRAQIYLAILTVRVLLSWFRNIDWFGEPWNTLRQVSGRRQQQLQQI
jgi:uncharacterized protein YggT (Ycf19 family)